MLKEDRARLSSKLEDLRRQEASYDDQAGILRQTRDRYAMAAQDARPSIQPPSLSAEVHTPSFGGAEFYSSSSQDKSWSSPKVLRRFEKYRKSPGTDDTSSTPKQ